jgi:hypothetical protein
MSWHDAKHAATAIITDAVNRENAADSLLQTAGRRDRRANLLVYDLAP